MNHSPRMIQMMRVVRISMMAAMLAASGFAAEEGGAEGEADLHDPGTGQVGARHGDAEQDHGNAHEA